MNELINAVSDVDDRRNNKEAPFPRKWFTFRRLHRLVAHLTDHTLNGTVAVLAPERHYSVRTRTRMGVEPSSNRSRSDRST